MFQTIQSMKRRMNKYTFKFTVITDYINMENMHIYRGDVSCAFFVIFFYFSKIEQQTNDHMLHKIQCDAYHIYI